MKNILRFGLMIVIVVFTAVACDDETDAPELLDSFTAISGTDAYSAPVNTTVEVSVDVRAQGLTSLTANGDAITFNAESKSSISM